MSQENRKMKEIINQKKIQQYIIKNEIDKIFLELPSMQLYAFQKDEVINESLNPEHYMMFLVKGIVHLTNIREDGSRFQINYIHPFTCFGDVEFTQSGSRQFGIIAESPCEILTISRARYQSQLDTDYLFLRFLIKSISEKMLLLSTTYAEHTSLEERLLFYIHRHNNVLIHIEQTADELGCSRRQLQRIIKKLCDDNVLIHQKKGRYIMYTK